MPGAAGRRARLRAELLAEIRTAALVELRRTGAAERSLREVARAAGISPAGLYRYVDGRDGLLELLISDGFDSFGAAIRSSLEVAGDDPVDRLRAVALGYRRWALDNSEHFGLILGTPVTGIRAHVVLESCARATWCSVKSLPPKGSNHFDGLTRNEQVRSSMLLSGSNRLASYGWIVVSRNPERLSDSARAALVEYQPHALGCGSIVMRRDRTRYIGTGLLPVDPAHVRALLEVTRDCCTVCRPPGCPTRSCSGPPG